MTLSELKAYRLGDSAERRMKRFASHPRGLLLTEFSMKFVCLVEVYKEAFVSFQFGGLMKQHAEVVLQKTKNLNPPVFDFGGHWKNELGSYMDLTVDANNNVTGKYVSAVSGNGGPTKQTDVQGTVTGDLIAFTVNWGSAITTWAGHGVFDVTNQPQILTLWHLVVSISDETNPQNQWETVMAGADSFFR